MNPNFMENTSMTANNYITPAMLDEVDSMSDSDADEKRGIELANLVIEQARILAPKVDLHPSFPVSKKEEALITFVGELLIEYANTLNKKVR